MAALSNQQISRMITADMMDDEGDYVKHWTAEEQSIEPPTRTEIHGNFNIVTKQTLRSNIEYAQVLKESKDERKSIQEPQATIIRQPSKSLYGIPKLIDPNDSVIDFNIFLIETEHNKVRGVVELSTLNTIITSRVRARVVCLFDVSGSMLLKCGRSRQDSKIAKLKKTAFELVDALSEVDEDYFGLVTFGDNSKIIVPLTKINSESKVSMNIHIDEMDQKVSDKTDLSEGLKTAINMLHEEYPGSRSTHRNVIMVFSDGEINKGTVQPEMLLHEVREKIRNAKPKLELQSDQWVNIVCITTGGNVSEAMYMLSKFCGNDAYYYIDSKVKNPELNMMIPFMLRKFSVAQSVTVNIVPADGVEINQKECSLDHSVRKKRQSTADQQLEYYLHDFPSGIQKHFSLSFDVDSNDIGNSDKFLKIQLEYVDNDGNIRSVEKEVTFNAVRTEYDDAVTLREGIVHLANADMRMSMQTACRKSADIFKLSQNNSKLLGKPAFILEDGKKEVSKIKDKYLKKTKDLATRQAIQNFEGAVQANLDSLIDTINKSVQGNGHKWTKLKAVSSSIVRETPNVSQLVVHSQTVCPLPKMSTNQSASDKLAALAQKISTEQQISESDSVNGPKLFGAASSLSDSLSRMIHSTLGRAAGSRIMADLADDDDTANDKPSSSSSDEENEFLVSIL